MRGARPHTASHGLPQFVMWSVWANQKRARPLTPAESPILGAIWLISRLNALLRPVESDRCAWEADRTLKSVRPICEADLWGRGSPKVMWSVRESDRPHRFESPIGLRREHGLSRTRPPTADRTTPAESPILGAIWLISRLNALLRPVESDRCAWEAARLWEAVCVRGRSDSQICEAVGVRKSCDLSHTASQIGLSDRSDSLTDLTDYIDLSKAIRCAISPWLLVNGEIKCVVYSVCDGRKYCKNWIGRAIFATL